MSTQTLALWVGLQSAAIAVAALAIAYPLRALLSRLPRGRRGVAWALLLIPFLTPTLLAGYAYSELALSLVHRPGCKRAVYVLLLLMRAVPLGTLMLTFAPEALSPEGDYCHGLLRRGGGRRLSWRRRAAFVLRGRGVSALVAAAVMFLVTFSEFELVSLMWLESWTVMLFDAKAVGEPLSGLLRRAVWPMAFQACVFGAVWLCLRGRAVAARPPRALPAPRGIVRAGLWVYLAAAVLGVAVAPGAVVLRDLCAGIMALVKSFSIGRDILAGVLFASLAAVCAHGIAGWVLSGRREPRRSALRSFAALGACVPGLLGPLVLALLLIAVFAAPGLRALYDTPVPLVMALTLLLLPFAVLFRGLIDAGREGEAVYAAKLLAQSDCPARRARGGRVLWRLAGSGRFWTQFALFWLAFFELTASALLQPVGLTPVGVRLYNLMHYGRIAMLSAMVCVVLLVPVAILAVDLTLGAMVRRAFRHA